MLVTVGGGGGVGSVGVNVELGTGVFVGGFVGSGVSVGTSVGV